MVEEPELGGGRREAGKERIVILGQFGCCGYGGSFTFSIFQVFVEFWQFGWNACGEWKVEFELLKWMSKNVKEA